MNITCVILESVEEQVAKGDRDIIVPTGVAVRPNTPAFVGFSYDVKDYFGEIQRTWIEDGRLMAEIKVQPGKEPLVASVGGSVLDSERLKDGLRVSSFDLLAVAIKPVR